MAFFLFVYNHPERLFDPDSALYIKLAESLLGSYTFPSLFRTPVYPSFIALVYSVFGHLPQAVVAAQIFLDSLTAVFVVLIFLEISRQKSYAYMAGFFYAGSPFSVFYSHMILSETLFAFILIVSIYCFILFLNHKKRGYLIASSVFLGAGVLCRPIALYLPFLLVAFVFMSGSRLRDGFINCLIFLFSFYIVLIPWYIRNYQQYEYLGIATVKDINMSCFEAPTVLMMKDNPLLIIQPSINESFYKYQIFFWERIKKQYGWEIEYPCRVGEDTEKLAILKKEGELIIKENIPIVLLSHTAGIGRTLCPYSPHFEKLTGYPVSIVKLLAFLTDAFLIVLSLFGIVFALRGSLNIGTGRFITVAIFVLILYLAFIPGIVGYTRFKIPIMPYISIFAALGMGGIRKDI
jgi:4-amino-4-deoxy-L-arabinose transferase-like glycosyltransferase